MICYKNVMHFLVIVYLISFSEGALRNMEQNLIEHLLTNYSKQARPVTNSKFTVNATFGIEIVQLIKVDDRNQFITSKIWVRQSWKNMLLTWDPDKWGELQYAQIDGNLLWTPDIVLYNNADDTFTGSTEKYKTRIIVYPDGTTSWLAPATFTSTCSIDIKYFPFDRQSCILKFGSWTFDKSGIDLRKDKRPLITNQYVNSSEWDITKTEKKVNVVKYECCINPFVDVTFTITLLRKPLYYVFNVITPCLVLVTTILFGFFLPPESGERISLTITILLAVAVFLQLISDALPRNSDSIPILAIFYMVIMAESAFSLLTTCVVLVIHYRSSEKGAAPMPEWIKSFFLGVIARKLGIRHTTGLKHPESDMTESYVNKTEYYQAWENESGIDFVKEYDGKQSVETMMQQQLKTRNTHVDNIDSTLDAILNEVQMITSSIRHNYRHGELQEEWRFLAKVLDRIFFWIFLFTVILSTTCILVPVYLKHH